MLTALILVVAYPLVGVIYGRLGESACSNVAFNYVRSESFPPKLECIRGDLDTGAVVKDASSVAVQRLVVAAVLWISTIAVIMWTAWLILRQRAPSEVSAQNE
jgi:hypothetical protein